MVFLYTASERVVFHLSVRWSVYLLAELALSNGSFLLVCSIMCVQFVPKTHLFFTGGKDAKIKQWDGDSFEHIVTVEVSCLL